MIEIKNLNKTYKPKKGQPVHALKNINLTIEDKGMVFILGKSGSGKSTLLHVLGGLDTYDSGELIIKGKSSSKFKTSDFDSYRNTLVGFIFQDYNILDEFSVGKNIMLALELQGQNATKEEVQKSLVDVGLEEFYNRKPNELSGGQKQRVAIARALIKNPEIIMADEPTGALDSKTGIQVFNTLKNLSRDKLVIVVSHDREFAELYADRIIELADGEIISDVQKYKTEPKQVVAGVNIIDNKAVIVKQGHKLTMSEFYYITNILNNITEDGDAIIPLSQKATKDVKKSLKISEDGTSTYFDKTNIYTRPIKNYGPNDLKLKKSRFPFWDSFKMGASALKHKKFRLFLTILLSSVAFAMFGFVNTLSSYNLADSTYQSIIESNITNITITKNDIEKYDGYETELHANFSNEDVKKFKEKFNRDFVEVKGKSGFYYNNFYNYANNFDKSIKYYNFHNGSVKGFASITNSEIENFKFDLIGKLPSYTSGETVSEVAITDFIFDHFKSYGYSIFNLETNVYDKFEINNFDDILNKTIRISELYSDGTTEYYTFKIVGIINTKMDMGRYGKLKTENLNYDLNTSLLLGEITTIIESSLSNVFFVNSEFITNNNLKFTNFIVSPLTNKTQDKDLINYVVKSETDTVKYKIENAASYLSNNFDTTLKQVASVLIYVGLGFALFASLLLFNFITTSISYKKREIGILRAVGARSSDVFGIFFNESFIIALINWLLATAFAWSTVIILNNTFRRQGLLVTLMNFGIWQILLIFAVSVLAAFISTILPVFKIANKKPIDAIKNR